MTIIIPEIYSKMVTEKVKGIVKISSYATDLGEVGAFSQEGDSITFPQFCALGDAELLARGAEISTEELRQTSTKKVVKHYGKGVEILDVDALEGKGNFLENAIMQQARIFAKARDTECMADIDANAILKKATASAISITPSELNGAFNLWGDEQDSESYEGIFINSRMLDSFLTMDGFVSTNVTYNANGNGIVRNGVVGFYRGIAVILTDVGTYDTTLNECKTYILKKGALGIKDKKNGVDIELERKAGFKKTNVYADEMFIIGLMQKDGVCIVRKSIA